MDFLLILGYSILLHLIIKSSIELIRLYKASQLDHKKDIVQSHQQLKLFNLKRHNLKKDLALEVS